MFEGKESKESWLLIYTQVLCFHKKLAKEVSEFFVMKTKQNKNFKQTNKQKKKKKKRKTEREREKHQ